MSLRGIEPDLGRHARDEGMVRPRSQPWTATVLPFRSRTALDALVPEQLEAADMDAGQEHDRDLCVDAQRGSGPLKPC